MSDKTSFVFSIILSSLAILLTVLYIIPLVSQATYFILLILIVTVVTNSEGFKGGLTMILISVVASIIAIYNNRLVSPNFLVAFNELSTFMVSSIILSWIIEKYKNTNLEKHYKNIEKKQTAKILKLEEESKKMQDEIKLRDEFLSIASHELKTPLTSMLIKIQLLLHNIRNVSLAKFSVQNLLDMLETAEEQTKKLSQMINDLLNVSLITTGKYRLEPQTEDLTEIVKEVVKEFSEKLDKKKLKLYTSQPVKVKVDKLRMSQVVTNLISNAIKYGNNKPIEIKVEQKNRTANIIVKDKGIGIEKDEIGKLFKLFERGKSSNNIKGLGVGLYISNQIVTAHGGRIRVESKLNKGSTFTVEIPQK